MDNQPNLEVIVRDDKFPFVCTNPSCGAQYDKNEVVNIIYRQGLIYAELHGDPKEIIFQGITCPACKQPILIPLDRPIVDLRTFLITPHPDMGANACEQLHELRSRDMKDKTLHFQFLPAWDQESVSLDKIKMYYKESPSLALKEDIPYSFSTAQEVVQRFQKEISSGSMKLRRVYPNIPKFKNLLNCIRPSRITKLEIFEDGFSNAFAQEATGKEMQERADAWCGLLEEAAGTSFRDNGMKLLRSKGYRNIHENIFRLYQDMHMFLLSYDEAQHLRELSQDIKDENRIWAYLRKVFDDVTHAVCIETALDPERDKLREWVTWIKDNTEGKALFVDAPMGLGKTHSIVDELSRNPGISAVLFFPTKALCEEVVENLKTQIASKKGIDNADDKEPILDSKGYEVKDEYGITCYRWKKTSLQDEVYYLDGRNGDCIHLKEFLKRYSRKRFKWQGICKNCSRAETCRFLKHEDVAKKARIVVTTHAQYDRFYHRKPLQFWHREGDSSEGRRVIEQKRDCFIVDEDMLLSNCYQPIPVEYEDLKDFIAAFTDFVSDENEHEKIIEKIYQFFGMVTRSDEDSAIIPPVAENLEVPEDLLKRWKEECTLEDELRAEQSDDSKQMEDYSDALIDGLQKGASIEKYTQKGRSVNRIFFPNSKYYDLSGLPPHVFFDGTMLSEEFLALKLKNVAFDIRKVDVKPLWRRRLWQNLNSDLPKRNTKEDKERVKRFVHELVEELGENHKYFFLTSKHTRNNYLEDFLKNELSHPPVLRHYRDLKGMNDAKDCDICIMLGSYIVSFAVERAMALELIHDKIVQGKVIIQNNDLWSWSGPNKPQRHYRKDYKIIEKLANSLRLSEHKQGIARTRYIFHDVDFYILSKDKVDTYEPQIEVQTYHYREDIFQPRKGRSDRKYNIVEKKAFEWLNRRDYCRVSNIHNITTISKRIVKAHLDEMVKKKLLVKEGKRYRFPLGKKRIIFLENEGTALNRQARIDRYGFPFTLNPNTGCFFACKYCYVPTFMKTISRERFTSEVKVKTWLPKRLDYELHAYRDLPQHLKRVQINESCESYLPSVIIKTKKDLGRDLIAEMFQVFERHWQEGNRWMLHIITKSPLILKHSSILSRMRHMVQVEMSFACLDESLRRKLEEHAPPTQSRLEAIRRLSDAGIFTRVMAMPFVSSKEEAEKLRELSYKYGARAYKHKELNYFEIKDVMEREGEIPKKKKRRDLIWEEFIDKSGEVVMEGGSPKKVLLPMPEKWTQWRTRNPDDWKDKLEEKELEVIRYGYSECNNVDWGYIY